MQGARWKHNPMRLPKQLRAAGRALEFGNFLTASHLIEMQLKSDRPKLREKAEQLRDRMQKQIEKLERAEIRTNPRLQSPRTGTGEVGRMATERPGHSRRVILCTLGR